MPLCILPLAFGDSLSQAAGLHHQCTDAVGPPSPCTQSRTWWLGLLGVAEPAAAPEPDAAGVGPRLVPSELSTSAELAMCCTGSPSCLPAFSTQHTLHNIISPCTNPELHAPALHAQSALLI